MIDLFYFTSPNVRKIRMALEELGLEYGVRWVDITEGEQFTPEYLRINPNNKVPAIIDSEGPGGRPAVLFESGSILQYLAEKTARLLPQGPTERWEATCWVFWQAANQGPACGNATYFHSYAPEQDLNDGHAYDRFLREAQRCYSVLDNRLADRDYLVDEFSIADIACFPWTRVAKGHGISLRDYPAVAAWSDRIAARASARLPEPARPTRARSALSSQERFEMLFPGSISPASGSTEAARRPPHSSAR